MRGRLEPVFILHVRRYRETSALLDVFSYAEGKIKVIAKGAYRPRSLWKGWMQPFVPLWADFYGRGDLLGLKTLEPRGLPYALNAKALPCGFYLNELLMRLLHAHDAQETIFDLYQTTLEKLSQTADIEVVLREFEKSLLEVLGYALPLLEEIETRQAILPEKFYTYLPERGFTEKKSASTPEKFVFLGEQLLSIAASDFSNIKTCRAAKRLMRLALAPLLGEAPLQSRLLWIENE